MDLSQLRRNIDEIDDQLIRLFCLRMEISAQIADHKKANNLPIHVPEREQEKLMDVAEKAGPEMASYAQMLYSTLFTLSRSYQSKRSGRCDEVAG